MSSGDFAVGAPIAQRQKKKTMLKHSPAEKEVRFQKVDWKGLAKKDSNYVEVRVQSSGSLRSSGTEKRAVKT